MKCWVKYNFTQTSWPHRERLSVKTSDTNLLQVQAGITDRWDCNDQYTNKNHLELPPANVVGIKRRPPHMISSIWLDNPVKRAPPRYRFQRHILEIETAYDPGEGNAGPPTPPGYRIHAITSCPGFELPYITWSQSDRLILWPADCYTTSFMLGSSNRHPQPYEKKGRHINL